MSARFGKLRAKLRYSFWFLPTVITLATAGLSLLLDLVDRQNETPRLLVWISLDVQGMREILVMVASSMITVATTAFSIVIVALQLASGQLGPRLLRNFIRDRSNQVAFGVFIGTFVYCLLLLRNLGNGTRASELPVIGFLGAMALTFTGVAVLIFFIHNAALSIQKDRVIARVSGELMESLDLLYPKTIGDPPPMVGSGEAQSQRLPVDSLSGWEDAEPLVLKDSGYIQAVDADKLMRVTQRANLAVYLIKRPGDFVSRGAVVARVRSEAELDRRTRKRLADVFILGIERTQQQDVGFVFDQLVEIAIRALSPGVNDSFTATRCIDRLTDALAVVARTAFPSPYRFDPEGQLRVVTNPVNFPVLISQVLYPVAEAAAGHSAVILGLFRSVEEIANVSTERHQQQPLFRFLSYVDSLSEHGASAGHRSEEFAFARARARKAIERIRGG